VRTIHIHIHHHRRLTTSETALASALRYIQVRARPASMGEWADWMWEETQDRKRRCPVFTHQHYRLFCLPCPALRIHWMDHWYALVATPPFSILDTGMLTSLHHIASICARRLPAHPASSLFCGIVQ
jgi:hypothetical protein